MPPFLFYVIDFFLLHVFVSPDLYLFPISKSPAGKVSVSPAVSKVLEVAVRKNGFVNSSCSTYSSSSSSSSSLSSGFVKTVGSSRRRKRAMGGRLRSVNLAPTEAEAAAALAPGGLKRSEWITANSAFIHEKEEITCSVEKGL